MNTLSITSNYNFESGYKQILKALLDGLPEFNYFVQPKSCSRINEDFKQYFLNDNTVSSSKVDLCLLSIVDEISSTNPLLYLNFNKPRILYTMWETTRMNDLLIEVLNNFKCIIVPNYYNKENLVKQGCTTRIEVVELFCDTNHFIYSKHIDKDFFVFGTANEDPRKNLNRVTNCFLKAFKNKSSVKLQIKTCNGNVTKFVGNNILHINKKYTLNELRDWYYNLDVYVSGATCEGWGMMQQESMCCGRPIIYTHYGGLKEFVNQDNSFQVKYNEVFAKGNWGHSVGKWSEFDEEDMIEKMIYCYSNKDEVYHKGYLASKSASQFTKERFLKKINTIISEYI